MIKMDDVWMAVDGPSPRSRPRADVTHGASRVSMRASVLVQYPQRATEPRAGGAASIRRRSRSDSETPRRPRVLCGH